MMDIKKLQAPLKVDQIDFRVQSVVAGGKGVVILAYKDARADMERLDEAVGPLNRKREHTRDNKNCIVSIWDEEKKQRISKEDTGTESNTEKEKGLASDSFKRACFNWGIGRELYDYPFIYITTIAGETEQYQGKWKTTNKFLRGRSWAVDHKNGISVTAKDATGKVRYSNTGDGGKQDIDGEDVEDGVLSDEYKLTIDDIKTIEELKQYREANKGIGKALDEYVSLRKAQILG